MKLIPRIRARFHTWRARRDMSPAAWAEHRRRIEADSKYEDAREIERQCREVLAMIDRLEAAARVGSQDARRRLQRFRLNPIGAAAASAAGAALQRLDAELMRRR